MTSPPARLVVVILGMLLPISVAARTQEVQPRGIPQPRRITATFPDPNSSARRAARADNATVYRRLILEQIQKDFAKLQALRDDLGVQLTANALDYKHIADAAGKIRTLAKRLDSNLVLGKVETPVAARAEPDPSDPALRSLLLALHDRVGSFVDNPIFRDRTIYDLEETRKAKSDVVEIGVVSNEVKKVAKQLKRNAPAK